MTPSFAVYLINLDQDRDRLAHMQGQLAAAGLEFMRVPAIDGRRLPAKWAARFPPAPKGLRPLKPGEAGCFASHLDVMERFLETDAAAALVLEDDLVVPAAIRSLMTECLTKLPAGFDIVRLSNPAKRAFITVAEFSGDSLIIRYSVMPRNTGAYLLSRAGAAKFLKSAQGVRPVDEEMRRPWLTGLDTFGVMPAPILSNIFESTIDTFGDRGLFHKPMIRLFLGQGDGLADRYQMARSAIETLGAHAWTRCLGRNLLHKVTPRLPLDAPVSAVNKRWRIR